MKTPNDSCTTLLVGKKASLDGSTIISRNEDGDVPINPKKMIVVRPEDQPVSYQSVSKKFTVTLPDHPLRYTATPEADSTRGVWGESGINAENVAMTATETITTNSRILALDPFSETGLGEEDMLTIVLPYIRSAAEGVERLGSLLTEYGTYESNGIAFSDKNEIWWLETLGGHHWAAVRIPDDAYVVAPNRLNIDYFDFSSPDVKCSSNLKEFIDQNHLNPDTDFYNLRHIFGSATIKDTHYNNPRAWYIQRHFTAQGENDPLSQDLPFIMYPDRKISLEDIKWALSSHYENTIYDPYNTEVTPDSHRFRPVAINRNSECHILQIFDCYPKNVSTIHWVAFGPNTFNYITPFFPQVDEIPAFFSGTTTAFDPTNSYWLNMISAVLGDQNFASCEAIFSRYEEAVMAQVRRIVHDTQQAHDARDMNSDSLEKINQEISDFTEKNYTEMLGEIVIVSAEKMKLQYNMQDN